MARKKNYIPVNMGNEPEEVKEVTEVAEVKKEEINVKDFVKRNWKKAAVGLGIIGAGILGFVLGKGKSDDDDLDLLEYDLDSEEEPEEDTTE